MDACQAAMSEPWIPSCSGVAFRLCSTQTLHVMCECWEGRQPTWVRGHCARKIVGFGSQQNVQVASLPVQLPRLPRGSRHQSLHLLSPACQRLVCVGASGALVGGEIFAEVQIVVRGQISCSAAQAAQGQQASTLVPPPLPCMPEGGVGASTCSHAGSL